MDNTLDILAHAGDAVCAVNDKKCVVYWNAAAENLFGIPAAEAQGQPCWKLMKGKTLDGQPFCDPDCPIQAQVDTQEPIPHFDLWVKNKRGSSILTNISTFTVPRPNGRRQCDQAAIIHLLRIIKKRELPQYDLHIHILGPLQVTQADGTPITGKFWHRAKVRGLFTYLALQRSKPVTRTELTETLWPELDHATALRSLNTTVYNLRRSLEPGLKQGTESNYIFYEAGHYWLGGSRPHWLDVDGFELGIQQARLETAVNTAILLYEEALALYRGDYLVDLMATTAAGSQTEQHRLRELYLSGLGELGSLYQQKEQTEEARHIYLKILSIDPSRESAYRQLAYLSHDTDTLMENVAYCQRLAAALKSELDLILNQDLNERHNPKA
jgi:PAS domain S-box-containing protein